jgi:hypothetical protein
MVVAAVGAGVTVGVGGQIMSDSNLAIRNISLDGRAITMLE